MTALDVTKNKKASGITTKTKLYITGIKKGYGGIQRGIAPLLPPYIINSANKKDCYNIISKQSFLFYSGKA